MSEMSEMSLRSAGDRYTHSQCILHRDLKQANIFLVGRRMVKLGTLDWHEPCLAKPNWQKRLHHLSSFECNLRLGVQACGTPYYLSPELCLGQKYNQKSDCWALGCVVYEMLTLKRPFHVIAPDVSFVMCTELVWLFGFRVRICMLW